MPIHRPLTLLGVPVLLSGIAYFLWLGDPSVTEEDHLIENGQLAFLLLAALLHGSRWRRAGDAVTRDFHACLGLLCLSIAIRELDIDRLGAAAIFEPLEKVLRGALIIVWLGFGTLLFRHRVLLRGLKRDLAFSPCSRISFIGILGYGCSWFFDKQVFPLDGQVQQLIEESIQLCATFLFVAAAVWQPFLARPTAGSTGESSEGVRGGSGAVA